MRLFHYCPNCGTETARHKLEDDFAWCKNCDEKFFPQNNLAASAAVLRGSARDAKILLVKRKNGWALPNGFLKPGEHPEDAAARETREETGIIAEPLRVVSIHVFGDRAVNPLVGHVFIARHAGGTLQPRLDEVLAAKWFKLNAKRRPRFAFNTSAELFDKLARWTAAGKNPRALPYYSGHRQAIERPLPRVSPRARQKT